MYQRIVPSHILDITDVVEGRKLQIRIVVSVQDVTISFPLFDRTASVRYLWIVSQQLVLGLCERVLLQMLFENASTSKSISQES